MSFALTIPVQSECSGANLVHRTRKCINNSDSAAYFAHSPTNALLLIPPTRTVNSLSFSKRARNVTQMETTMPIRANESSTRRYRWKFQSPSEVKLFVLDFNSQAAKDAGHLGIRNPPRFFNDPSRVYAISAPRSTKIQFRLARFETRCEWHSLDCYLPEITRLSLAPALFLHPAHHSRSLSLAAAAGAKQSDSRERVLCSYGRRALVVCFTKPGRALPRENSFDRS